MGPVHLRKKREFPGGRVVRILPFHCWGPDFNFWLGELDPTSHTQWKNKGETKLPIFSVLSIYLLYLQGEGIIYLKLQLHTYLLKQTILLLVYSIFSLLFLSLFWENLLLNFNIFT